MSDLLTSAMEDVVIWCMYQFLIGNVRQFGLDTDDLEKILPYLYQFLIGNVRHADAVEAGEDKMYQFLIGNVRQVIVTPVSSNEVSVSIPHR